MTAHTRPRSPAVVLTRVKQELRVWTRILAETPRPDDRVRGQLETLRHIATVIRNAEGGGRRVVG